jgi:hypothetical protein
MALSDDLREDFMSRILPHLRAITAEQISTGLGFAELFSVVPQSDLPAAMGLMNEHAERHGLPALTLAEATLLARLALKHPELADPSQVDPFDPCVQEVNRQLAEIWRGPNQRDYDKGAAEGAAAAARLRNG